MVRRFLERCQHEHTVLHLRDAEPSDAKHLALVEMIQMTFRTVTPLGVTTYLISHNIPKQHTVARIDIDTVTGHRELDLVDDRSPCGLNPQNLLHFDNMVRYRLLTHDAHRGHDLLEARPLDDELLLAFLPSFVILLFDVDHGPSYAREAL